MRLSEPRFALSSLSMALCAMLPALAQASVAGRFQFVLGDVRVIDLNGQERPAQKGQEISEGETLRTGPNASAQVKMIDGGLIAMRPESQIKLDTYAIQGGDVNKEKATISLVKGGFRTVTGLIGKTNKENYSVTTPTATIGIRGTDHEPAVLAPPPPGAPTANPAGTYDKVNVGATSLTTQAGTALIARNQVGFAGSPIQAPVILPKMPSFYQAVTPPASKQEAPKPATQGQQAQTQGGGAGQKADDKPASTGAASSTTAGSSTQGSTSTTTEAGVRVSAPLDTAQISAPVATPIPVAAPVVTLPLTGTDNKGGSLNTASSTGSAGNRSFAPGPAVLLTYADSASSSRSFSANGPALRLTRDSSNFLSNAYFSGYDNGTSYNYAGSGYTATDAGQNSATGLNWGRWQGGQVTQTTTPVTGSASTQTSTLGASSLHWITGQQINPFYLASVLTGTANYTYVGGTRPTDGLGNVGALNSATLAANFTAQTVNAGANFTISSNTWNVQSNNIPLQWGNNFQSSICSTCTTRPGVSNTFTKNGVNASTTASANLNGQLMGTNLGSAALAYSVNDNSSGTTNIIQGVAGFSGPAQNPATAYRVGTIGNGFNFVDYSASNPTYLSNFTGALDILPAPANRVVSSSAGLTEFMGPAIYVPTGLTTFASAETATAKIGTAVNRDVGSTLIDTVPVSWGRWEGGTVDVYSVDGGTKLGSINNLNKNFHWVVSGTLTSLPTGSLPLTGTATYALAGATSPTDMQGNVGTLGSVTLNADFSALRANTTVTANFSSTGNNGTWSMTANNVPISTSGEFKSNSSLNGSNSITHTTTCSGTACGSQSYSAMNGVFVGTGAAGAVLSYRMITGNTGTTTYTGLPSNFTPTNGITGVAVLKK